ncbi:MAG: J domain-containing protein [Sphingomonadales bacterium]
MIKFLFFVALIAAAVWLVMQKKPGSKMLRSEAAKLLGVAADASTDSVIDAHRRLIAKVHPDAGGNAELAARINQARDTLLKP